MEQVGGGLYPYYGSQFSTLYVPMDDYKVAYWTALRIIIRTNTRI